MSCEGNFDRLVLGVGTYLATRFIVRGKLFFCKFKIIFLAKVSLREDLTFSALYYSWTCLTGATLTRSISLSPTSRRILTRPPCPHFQRSPINFFSGLFLCQKKVDQPVYHNYLTLSRLWKNKNLHLIQTDLFLLRWIWNWKSNFYFISVQAKKTAVRRRTWPSCCTRAYTWDQALMWQQVKTSNFNKLHCEMICDLHYFCQCSKADSNYVLRNAIELTYFPFSGHREDGEFEVVTSRPKLMDNLPLVQRQQPLCQLVATYFESLS